MKQNTKARFLKWCDGWALSGMGILKSLRDWRFWVGFIVAFLAFGTLMNLLANGLGVFGALAGMDFSGRMAVIGGALLGIFGVNMALSDWLLVFLIALLQGVLIGLLVVVWRRKKAAKKHREVTVAAKTGAQNAGLAAGLAVLGSGCPTCGTTLLAPVIGAISSTGGYALASTLSGLLMAAAIIIALLTIKKTGEEAYVIIVSDEYAARHAKIKKIEEEK